MPRKKGIQPDTYICVRCHNEIFDRSPKRFGIIKYCAKCKNEVKAEYNNKRYRRTHPRPIFKQDLLLKALEKKPRTAQELQKLAKIKNIDTLKNDIYCLRKRKGYDIKAVHIIQSHYILVGKK